MQTKEFSDDDMRVLSRLLMTTVLFGTTIAMGVLWLHGNLESDLSFGGVSGLGSEIPTNLLIKKLNAFVEHDRQGGIKALRVISKDERYSSDVRAWSLCRVLNDIRSAAEGRLDLRDVVADPSFNVNWLDARYLQSPFSMMNRTSKYRGSLVAMLNIPFMGTDHQIAFLIQGLTAMEFEEIVDAYRRGIPVDRNVAVSQFHTPHPLFPRTDSTASRPVRQRRTEKIQ